MVDNIYIAPNIRKQKLEDVEDFINAKRVQRLVMAQSYQQTVKDKAEKLHGKSLDRFSKQAVLFDTAMERLIDQIEKMQERLTKMSEVHSELVNLEGVINEET
jgi:hypothetical protein